MSLKAFKSAANLEVDSSETATDNEGVALVDGSIGLQEVGLQEDLEPVSGQAFDGVIDGQNMDPLPVLDVRTFRDRDDVAETNSKVVSDDSVHSDLLVGDGVVAQNDADGLLALLALQQDSVASKQTQLVHLGLREGDHRVVVVDRLFDDQSVRPGLLVQDGGGQPLVALRVLLTSGHLRAELPSLLSSTLD